MSNAGAALIWCPFADEASAKDVARMLLEAGLIACANILPGVTSVYRWQDKIEEGSEVGVLFKTTQAALKNAVARLEELHPYDTPAIMGWHVGHAPAATLAWLSGEVPEQGRSGHD